MQAFGGEATSDKDREEAPELRSSWDIGIARSCQVSTKFPGFRLQCKQVSSSSTKVPFSLTVVTVAMSVRAAAGQSSMHNKKKYIYIYRERENSRETESIYIYRESTYFKCRQ